MTRMASTAAASMVSRPRRWPRQCSPTSACLQVRVGGAPKCIGWTHTLESLLGCVGSFGETERQRLLSHSNYVHLASPRNDTLAAQLMSGLIPIPFGPSGRYLVPSGVAFVVFVNNTGVRMRCMPLACGRRSRYRTLCLLIAHQTTESTLFTCESPCYFFLLSTLDCDDQWSRA